MGWPVAASQNRTYVVRVVLGPRQHDLPVGLDRNGQDVDFRRQAQREAERFAGGRIPEPCRAYPPSRSTRSCHPG